MRLSLLPLALSALIAIAPVGADDQCKQAGLPQSRCVKDSQCCKGLVCKDGRCQSGCHIGTAFQASTQRNSPPSNCQSCQPAVSTTAWTNVSSGTPCRDSNGACDPAESCNGTSGKCPTDLKKTGACRDGNGPCNPPESCDGSHDTCPGDVVAGDGAPCPGGVCMGGTCTIVTTTTVTTTTVATTTTTLPACGDASFPTCGGTCEPGNSCYPFISVDSDFGLPPSGCHCAPTGAQCIRAQFCGGGICPCADGLACPEGMVCRLEQYIEGYCNCVSAPQQ